MVENLKPIEYIRKDVNVWNPRIDQFEEGKIRNIAAKKILTEIVWTNTPLSTTAKVPDIDKIINVEFAREIAIQFHTLHGDNVSTDADLNVYASVDGGLFDTVPYAERNIGDTAVKTFLISPGPIAIRLRLDNNDSSNAAYVTALVLVEE